MKRLAALTAVLAAATSGSVAAADPGPTPHGSIGACNGMTSPGMDNAIDHANLNGILGMVKAIENTTPYGPPDYCPTP
jgi:hypothetical protein